MTTLRGWPGQRYCKACGQELNHLSQCPREGRDATGALHRDHHGPCCPGDAPAREQARYGLPWRLRDRLALVSFTVRRRTCRYFGWLMLATASFQAALAVLVLATGHPPDLAFFVPATGSAATAGTLVLTACHHRDHQVARPAEDRDYFL